MEVIINRRDSYRQSEESSKTNVTASLVKMITIQQAIWKDTDYVTATIYATIIIVLVNQSTIQWETWIDFAFHNIVAIGF
jgi:hypothetical protein